MHVRVCCVSSVGVLLLWVRVSGCGQIMSMRCCRWSRVWAREQRLVRVLVYGADTPWRQVEMEERAVSAQQRLHEMEREVDLLRKRERELTEKVRMGEAERQARGDAEVVSALERVRLMEEEAQARCVAALWQALCVCSRRALAYTIAY